MTKVSCPRHIDMIVPTDTFYFIVTIPVIPGPGVTENSAEHEICSADISQVTKNWKFILAKHS